jgi:hypothetical protein
VANEQNLQPKPAWKKGESGNPKGRPPKTITAFMRELGEGTLLDCKMRMLFKGEIITKEIDFQSLENKRKYVATLNEIVATKVVQQAIAGDIQSQKMLIEAQNPTVASGDKPQNIQPPNVTFTRENMSNDNSN